MSKFKTFSYGILVGAVLVAMISTDTKPSMPKPTITETVPATVDKVDKPKMSTEITAVYDRLLKYKEVSFMELDQMTPAEQLEVVSFVRTSLKAELLQLDKMLKNSTVLKKNLYEYAHVTAKTILHDVELYADHLNKIVSKKA